MSGQCPDLGAEPPLPELREGFRVQRVPSLSLDRRLGRRHHAYTDRKRGRPADVWRNWLMALREGHHIPYLWQGISNHCWLTCIEMVMMYEHGNRYGLGRQRHTDNARLEKRRGRGSHICIHAADYGLEPLPQLEGNTDLAAWSNALRAGPIIASGKYGWVAAGVGRHVIVILGLSHQNKLVFHNPNIMGIRPERFWRSNQHFKYATIERIVNLADRSSSSAFLRNEAGEETDTGGPIHPFYGVAQAGARPRN